MFITGIGQVCLGGGRTREATPHGEHVHLAGVSRNSAQQSWHEVFKLPRERCCLHAQRSERTLWVRRYRREPGGALGALAQGASRQPGERFGRVQRSEKQTTLGTSAPLIEAPAHNCRRIAAAVRVDAPIALVWQVLTDYNHLADFIPNLAVSQTFPHPSGGIRLQQEGVQNVFGFRFRAAVLMDMNEVIGDPKEVPHRRSIYFDLVHSRDFIRFEGEWYMEERDAQRSSSDIVSSSNDRIDASLNRVYTTLGYVVEIVPRHMLPVRLVEWRIREDLLPNLLAVKREAERRYLLARRAEAVSQSQRDASSS